MTPLIKTFVIYAPQVNGLRQFGSYGHTAGELTGVLMTFKLV